WDERATLTRRKPGWYKAADDPAEEPNPVRLVSRLGPGHDGAGLGRRLLSPVRIRSFPPRQGGAQLRSLLPDPAARADPERAGLPIDRTMAGRPISQAPRRAAQRPAWH